MTALYAARIFILWETFMKHNDSLISIVEIAKALGVTRRIILHYEERGLIYPDSRDEATGNRCSSIDTFTQLRSIRSLQNLGLFQRLRRPAAPHPPIRGHAGRAESQHRKAL